MKPRKVSKLGVQYRDKFYTHPQLAPHVTRSVTIESLPGAPAQLAVYDRRGELICEAYRQRELPPEIVAAILLERGDLRAQDRRWWRRLLTQIEVDAREHRAAAEPNSDQDTGGGSLLEALFGQLPGQEATPQRSEADDETLQETAPLAKRPPTGNRRDRERKGGVVNRPVPDRTGTADEGRTADA